MDARAEAKYVRISGRKVNKYGRAVRNLPYKEAKAALNVITAHGARVLYKVIQSAVSNLMVKSKNIDEDSIRINTVTINEGPTLKRWRPRARGRADRIRKRTCHIAVVVSGEEIKK
jgi:large subunit ribosomal protein L22